MRKPTTKVEARKTEVRPVGQEEVQERIAALKRRAEQVSHFQMEERERKDGKKKQVQVPTVSDREINVFAAWCDHVPTEASPANVAALREGARLASEAGIWQAASMHGIIAVLEQPKPESDDKKVVAAYEKKLAATRQNWADLFRTFRATIAKTRKAIGLELVRRREERRRLHKQANNLRRIYGIA